MKYYFVCDTGAIWNEDEIKMEFGTNQDLFDRWGDDFDAYMEWLLDLGKRNEGGLIEIEEAYTFGYGVLPVHSEEEDFLYAEYNDAKICGKVFAVGESEETGILVEVRERDDGTRYAVIVEE